MLCVSEDKYHRHNQNPVRHNIGKSTDKRKLDAAEINCDYVPYTSHTIGNIDVVMKTL
jgi:hypothetical protein